MTGHSTSSFRGTPKQTKIYVDGFRIDTISTPKEGTDIREVAMTPAVLELLEGREVTTIVPIPIINPKFIIITTVL